MNDEELITENDMWRIYHTGLSKELQKDIDGFTDKGIRLGDYYRIYQGERKDNGDRYYLIFDKKTGKAIDYFYDIKEIDFKKWVLESAILDKFDIRNMARK